MKRIMAFMLCVLLLLPGLGGLSIAAAEGEPPESPAQPEIQVTGYSVAGDPDVPNAYLVTLNLKWHTPDATEHMPIHSLTISTQGSNFKLATRVPTLGGYRYTVSNTALDVDKAIVKSLNDGKAAMGTFYFLKIGGGDELVLDFSYSYGSPSLDGSNTDTITVVKSTPDPPTLPQLPDPEPVDTTKFKPELEIVSEGSLPVIDQSTSLLTIPIRNSAAHMARKIKITLEPVDKSKPLFMPGSLSLSAEIDSLSRNDIKEAEFPVTLAPGATVGVHTIQLNFSYQNTHGDKYTSSDIAYVRVDSGNIAPRLIAGCTDTLIPGQQKVTTFTISNLGETAARDIRVTLLGLDPSAVSTINDIDVKYIDEIAAGESEKVQYRLFTTGTLEGASTRLQLQIDYLDISGEAYSETKHYLLPLAGGKAEEDKGVPRLIISKYSFSPQEIRAGNQFVLDMDLQNTSRNKAVSNIKVTIIAEEGTFLPVDASNTLFIETILPGEMTTASLPLVTKADAENKPYPLRITFEYEDNQGNAYNAQEMISIPVRQNPRLMVGDVMMYGEPFLWQMLPINVEFYNLGKTILYNLMVKAEGPFQLDGGSYFVGNFNPGQSDSFNFAVTPTEPGELVGTIVFEFEDSVGNPMQVRREFTMNVMEPFYPEDPGPELPPPPPPTNKWKYVGIGAAVFVVLVGGFIWFRRRRQRQKIAMQNAIEQAAATDIVVPEIEYVGFDDPPSAENDKPEPKQ